VRARACLRVTACVIGCCDYRCMFAVCEARAYVIFAAHAFEAYVIFSLATWRRLALRACMQGLCLR
jgi:hypothetical protein